MRIGIISNSDAFIPLVFTLATQQVQVSIFYCPSKDDYINQKVISFISQSKLAFTEEKSKDKDLYKWLLEQNLDTCFILGYPYLIDTKKIKNIPTQLFNIHFGPLPCFKGPVPVFWQLKMGVENLGLSIHQLTERFDDGPLVWLKETANLPHFNYQSVNQLFSQLSVEGAFYILRFLINRLPLPYINRDHLRPTYQKRPKLKDVSIDWQKMKAQEICNLVSACNPWNKGASTFFQNQELKIMDALILQNNTIDNGNEPAGTITEDKSCLNISCSDGFLIQVNMVFYADCFIPAYQCRAFGLLKGKQLGY